MRMQPTYSAKEILEMCRRLELDDYTIRIIIDLIDEELDLYNESELVILIQASMILFNRSLLKRFLHIR